eukprot:GHVL01033657.1.p1 GENE.GHVL01033657.1~~GHVL01033657.1.p1  ORF type:complete len:665 (+),score=201.70 GHVL01033657.1:227-2221(+)
MGPDLDRQTKTSNIKSENKENCIQKLEFDNKKKSENQYKKPKYDDRQIENSDDRQKEKNEKNFDDKKNEKIERLKALLGKQEMHSDALADEHRSLLNQRSELLFLLQKKDENLKNLKKRFSDFRAAEAALKKVARNDKSHDLIKNSKNGGARMMKQIIERACLEDMSSAFYDLYNLKKKEFINKNDEFIDQNDEFINKNDEFIDKNDEFIDQNDDFIDHFIGNHDEEKLSFLKVDDMKTDFEKKRSPSCASTKLSMRRPSSIDSEWKNKKNDEKNKNYYKNDENHYKNDENHNNKCGGIALFAYINGLHKRQQLHAWSELKKTTSAGRVRAKCVEVLNSAQAEMENRKSELIHQLHLANVDREDILRKHHIEIDRLKNEISQLQDFHSQLKQEGMDQVNTVRSEYRDIAETQEKIREIQLKREKDLEKQVFTQSQQLQDALKSLQSFELLSEEQKDELDSLKRVHQTLKRQNEELLYEIEEKKECLNKEFEEKGEILKINQKYEELTRRHEGLVRSTENCSKQYNEAQEEISRQYQQISINLAENDNLKKELTQQKESVESLRKERDFNKEEIEKIILKNNEDMKNIKNDYTQLVRQHEGQIKESAKLEFEMQQKQNDFQHFKEIHEDLKNSLNELHDTISKQQYEIQQLKKHLADGQVIINIL